MRCGRGIRTGCKKIINLKKKIGGIIGVGAVLVENLFRTKSSQFPANESVRLVYAAYAGNLHRSAGII